MKSVAMESNPSSICGENNMVYVGSSILSTMNPSQWFVSAYDVTDQMNPVLKDTAMGTGRNWALEVRDGVILGTFPGGTLRSFAYDLNAGKIVAGPVLHVNAQDAFLALMKDGGNLFAFVGGDVNPPTEYAKGMRGTYIAKAILRKPGEVVLTTSVNPPEAAFAGCTMVPSPGEHLYPRNTTVSLQAQAVDPWNFFNWTGDVSGTSPKVDVLIDRDKIAVANFVRPILWLHAFPPERRLLYPYQVIVEKDTILVQEIVLEVNDVDDWQLSSITFKAEGTGDEKNDLYRVYLVGAGYNQYSTYAEDDGTIIFRMSKIIPKGGSLRFKLYYHFSRNTPLLLDILDKIKTYMVRIHVNMVDARPIHYNNFQKRWPDPLVSNPIELANVKNLTRQIGYTTINEAVNQVQASETIEAGPGIFEEGGIEINKKSVTVRSYKGPDYTTIQMSAPRKSIFHVLEDSISIEGFTFKCGIETKGVKIGMSELKDLFREVKINNCVFEGSLHAGGNRCQKLFTASHHELYDEK